MSWVWELCTPFHPQVDSYFSSTLQCCGLGPHFPMQRIPKTDIHFHKFHWIPRNSPVTSQVDSSFDGSTGSSPWCLAHRARCAANGGSEPPTPDPSPVSAGAFPADLGGDTGERPGNPALGAVGRLIFRMGRRGSILGYVGLSKSARYPKSDESNNRSCGNMRNDAEWGQRNIYIKMRKFH